MTEKDREREKERKNSGLQYLSLRTY